MDQEHADYLLGSGDAELRRLAFQHRAWAEMTFALWRRAGFGRGHAVLDLGCGPGFAALDLAHLVGPEGRVLAADASPDFLRHAADLAAAQGVDWLAPMEVDALDLDLSPAAPAGGLDGAHARWLLCFLSRPQRAVDGIARHLAPGGRLAVIDYFNYGAFTLAPRSAAFDRVVAGVAEAWRRSGGDLEVGGRVPAMMCRAGLELVDVRLVVRTARPGSPLWAWPETFFRGFLPRLVDDGVVTEDEAAAFWHDWRARAADPAAFLALPPLVNAVGRRPPS